MSSIFDMFKQVPIQASAAQSSAAGNTTVPNAENTLTKTPEAGATPEANASPLAQFQKLWDTDPNAKPEEPFSFNSDPAKLLDTARGVDFTKSISPEVMARIQAGGEDAQKAMLEAMNSTVQQSFAHSAHASAKITEAALKAQEERFKALLPNLIKQHTVQDSFRQDNPLMTDPALAPMIHALQTQFTQKYPGSTAVEIKNYVNEYLDGAAKRIQDSRAPKTQDKAAPGEDWEKFFTQ